MKSHALAAIPGATGFLGAVSLPAVSPAHWAACAATFSGLMGGLWFAVQIALAIEKRLRDRRK